VVAIADKVDLSSSDGLPTSDSSSDSSSSSSSDSCSESDNDSDDCKQSRKRYLYIYTIELVHMFTTKQFPVVNTFAPRKQ